MALLGHDHDEPLGQAGDVGAATAARQPHRGTAPVTDVGGIEVAVTVDLRGAEEAQIDQPLLEEPHHIDGPGAPEGARDIGGVAHGHERLGCRPVADDPVLEEPDGSGGVDALGEGEGDQRQAHADEHHVALADLPPGGDDHQLAVGVAGRHR